ncbi:hypothetical protein Peur_006239 [Populus x canadensis]
MAPTQDEIEITHGNVNLSLSTSALKEDKETCSSGNNQRQDSHLSWGDNQGQRLQAYSWQSIPKDGHYIQRE